MYECFYLSVYSYELCTNDLKSKLSTLCTRVTLFNYLSIPIINTPLLTQLIKFRLNQL